MLKKKTEHAVHSYIAFFLAILLSKMGSLEVEIKSIKSSDRILMLQFQTDMTQIFQMRYFKTFNVNL